MVDNLKRYNEMILARLDMVFGDEMQKKAMTRLLDVVLLEFLMDYYAELEEVLEGRIKDTTETLLKDIDSIPSSQEAADTLRKMLNSLRN